MECKEAKNNQSEQQEEKRTHPPLNLQCQPRSLVSGWPLVNHFECINEVFWLDELPDSLKFMLQTLCGLPIFKELGYIKLHTAPKHF